jgi:predicted dehydrogenase
MSVRIPRRDFLRLTAGTALAMAGPTVRAIPQDDPAPTSDRPIGLATIGMGIIGFIDTTTALQVPGVELVAAADLYDGRRERTREVYGNQVSTTVDYREILARDDVDAVIVATPDHWHSRITIEALEAGKHVYCEKPMVQTVAEGRQVIAAEERTGKVVQVGSQYASSISYHYAKKLIESGTIGKLSQVEARWNRNSSLGAWQYSIPIDASPETIDWKRFLGHAPDRPFDAKRFFQWRGYWDYGTGVGGDLFVHLVTGIHTVTGAIGPVRVFGTGGLRHWHDGREAPDVMFALCDYEETESHPEFTLELQCNFADGGGGRSFVRFTGAEGVLEVDVSGKISVTRRPASEPPIESVLEGYNSVRTFSEQGRADFEAAYRRRIAQNPPRPAIRGESEYEPPSGYDARLDHFRTFFAAVRGGAPVQEDSTFGLRAAAPALLANRSYLEKRAIGWNPVTMTAEA